MADCWLDLLDYVGSRLISGSRDGTILYAWICVRRNLRPTNSPRTTQERYRLRTGGRRCPVPVARNEGKSSYRACPKMLPLHFGKLLLLGKELGDVQDGHLAVWPESRSAADLKFQNAFLNGNVTIRRDIPQAHGTRAPGQD